MHELGFDSNIACIPSPQMSWLHQSGHAQPQETSPSSTECLPDFPDSATNKTIFVGQKSDLTKDFWHDKKEKFRPQYSKMAKILADKASKVFDWTVKGEAVQ